jgi:hypothetical protein
MIAAIVTGVGILAITVALCLAVYDPSQIFGMSLAQQIRFCLRQLGSSWPWR